MPFLLHRPPTTAAFVVTGVLNLWFLQHLFGHTAHCLAALGACAGQLPDSRAGWPAALNVSIDVDVRLSIFQTGLSSVQHG